MSSLTRIAIGAVLIVAAAGAAAQPAKPVRIVVAFPAGGPIDLVARMIAPKLSETLAQPVVVDNRSGANGIIGTDYVAKSAPDGYTMILASVSAITISPVVYPKMPYDSLRDFAPVTLVSTTPELLVVHPSIPAKSVKEFVALAKARPGQLNIASTGSGGLPHLALELLKKATQTDMLHVPYTGAAPSVSALLGGQVTGMFADLPVLLPHVQAGKLRALALAAPKRSALLPDLSTMGEQGLPSVEADQLVWDPGYGENAARDGCEAARRSGENARGRGRARENGRPRRRSGRQHARAVRRLPQERHGALGEAREVDEHQGRLAWVCATLR